jgi:hypothetical protein
MDHFAGLDVSVKDTSVCIVDNVSVPYAQHHHVAVGGCASHPARTDAAASTADILDNNSLAKRRLHPVRENAAEHVGQSAWWKRHNHRNGSRWIWLCSCGPRNRGKCSSRCQIQNCLRGNFMMMPRELSVPS